MPPRVKNSGLAEVQQSIYQYLRGQSFNIKTPLSGVNLPALPHLLDFFSESRSNDADSIICILPTEKEALRTANAWQEIKKSSKSQIEVEYLPSWGILPYSYGRVDRQKEGQRARVLAKIMQQRQICVVTSFDSLNRKTVSPQMFNAEPLTLKTGQELDLLQLNTFLMSGSYEKSSLVEARGQFSHRGGIWDIFCPGYDYPVRIDLFGDEIESIRFFDPIEQRSQEELEQLELYPANEINFSKEQFEELSRLVKIEAGSLYTLPSFTKNTTERNGMYDLFPLLSPGASLLDYFKNSVDMYIYDPVALERRLNHFHEELIFLSERSSNHLQLKTSDLFIDDENWGQIKNNSTAISLLPRDGKEHSLAFKDSTEYKGRFSRFVQDYLEGTGHGNQFFCSFSTSAQRERFEHILSGYGELTDTPKVMDSELPRGFCWPGFSLLTEYEIFGKTASQKKISKTTTEIIESFVDLSEGDIIVHINYGIGRFVRLKRMAVRDIERDFLELEFADSDKLYVPLDQLNLVHRYIGSTENPRLDYLGKRSSWEKTRARVSETVEKLAGELIELYAKREKMRGYAFSTDNRIQEEFEASFPFEETDHQIAAINEVKKDMEGIKPMDRLICGDVGFGKTEVAIRAAFKAAMEGKQVALLCPTTILAMQHFNNFKNRFFEYPVAIDLLSRFRTPAEQKKIREQLSIGNLDIVIGTHALLSEQVQYKDLGLLIVDEEQRFGVSHKEKVRQLKSNIDTLTMTATPIPRTLHMSLVGIRDLSLIETPPPNRKKIGTQVMEESEHTLRQAIKSELDRQGQVYILHNKVKTIEAQASRISNMIPQARVAFLHGQMDEEQIEETMLDFYNHRFDVLVATTIIESGIDIPNVNTLVVLSAAEFGLSQLYQLKGRVGRSAVQAFAYFFYSAHGTLTEVAQKRLNTLQEYDDLGSGFKIAMKDLELRGAGNLLGKEQSGDIVDVGFELYVQMLQSKVEELKGNVADDDFRSQIVISQDFYFPENYIQETRQKMEFYKKLASAKNIEAIEDIEAELTDRFGRPPGKVAAMILQEEVRVLSDQLKFDKVEWLSAKNYFELIASPFTTLEMTKLTDLLSRDSRFQLDPDDARKLIVKPTFTEFEKALVELKGILDFILG
jgi:transcription-repair coupling factor (superfamily II helicase)